MLAHLVTRREIRIGPGRTARRKIRIGPGRTARREI